MITQTEVEKIFVNKFENCLQPLREISRDFQKGTSMVDSSLRFYCYDKIAEIIYEGQNKPKSPDMVLFKKDSLVLVEFKNGEIHSKDKDIIKLKAVEGGFIVLHKIISRYKETNFDDIYKLNKSYVLVYNTKENTRYSLHHHVYSKTARFGLSIYEGTFFSRVRTVSPVVFSQLLHREKIEEWQT
jgi:hypothetical protein